MFYDSYNTWLTRVYETHGINLCWYGECARITYLLDEYGEEIAWFDKVDLNGWVKTWGEE